MPFKSSNSVQSVLVIYCIASTVWWAEQLTNQWRQTGFGWKPMFLRDPTEASLMATWLRNVKSTIMADRKWCHRMREDLRTHWVRVMKSTWCVFWDSCFVGTLTWLCLPPHSEPKAAWSPWRSHGRRSHSAKYPLELYKQREKEKEGTHCQLETLQNTFSNSALPFHKSLPLLLIQRLSSSSVFLLTSCTLGSTHDGCLHKEAYSALFLPPHPDKHAQSEVTIQLNLTTIHRQRGWLAPDTVPRSLCCPQL